MQLYSDLAALGAVGTEGLPGALMGREARCTAAYMRVPVESGEPQPIGISTSPDGHVQFLSAFGALQVPPNDRQLVYVGRGESGGSEHWPLENFLPKSAK